MRFAFKYTLKRAMWNFILNFGCFFVEDWLFLWFDFYAVLLCMTVFAGDFLPTFAFGGNLPCQWDNRVARGCLVLAQYCHRRVCGPSCTSVQHGRV